MKYMIGDTIVTRAGAYKVLEIVHEDGSCDKSINLYIGKSLTGIHTDLIMSDNACCTTVGGDTDDEENYNQFEAIGDRLNIDLLYSLDFDLANFISYEKRRAERFELAV